jgi:signal transduction histidine kinase/GAF domain-containing protein
MLQDLLNNSLEDINSFPAGCLMKVLGHICGFMNCDYGVILTIDKQMIADKQKERMTLDVIYGYLDEDVLEFRNNPKIFPIGIGKDNLVSAEAYEKRKTIIKSGDVPNFRLTEGVKKILSHPVKREEGEIDAILTLESRSESGFSKYEKGEDLVEILLCGRLVAAALHARQSLLFKFDEFLKLKKYSATGKLALDSAEWIRQAFRVNSCAIYFSEYIPDKFKSQLRCKASVIGGREIPEAVNRTYEDNEGYVGWVFAQKRHLYLPEFENDKSPALDNYEKLSNGVRPKKTGNLNENFRDIKFKSYIGVPLSIGLKTIGVLEILDTTRDYAESDVPLLKAIGSRIAEEFLVINKNRRQEKLYIVPNIQTGNFQKVIRGVVDTCMAVTEASHGFFMEKKDGFLHPRAVRGVRLDKLDIETVSTDDEDSILIKTLRKKYPQHEYDFPEFASIYEQSDKLITTLRGQEVKTFLLVPVQLEIPKETGIHSTDDTNPNQLEDLGVLVLASLDKDAFQEEEILIAALAEIVSYNIWGSRKFEELKDARADIAKLERETQFHNKIVTAAAFSAATMHSAKRHMEDLVEPINSLSTIIKDSSIQNKVKIVTTGVKELIDIFDRLHLMYAEGIAPNKAVHDLATLIQETRTHMQSTFSRRNIKFHSLIKPQEYSVYVDDLLFKVVLINLMRNSIEANTREIIVRADVTESRNKEQVNWKFISIKFKDNGDGIEEEDFKIIFEPFKSTKEDGMGVGLTVNKNIIEKMDGEINILSSTIGKGTTFEILLPEEKIKITSNPLKD